MLAEEELKLDISDDCVRCLRFTVDNMSRQNIYSSEFRFKGGGWKLNYDYDPDVESQYGLGLVRCSGVALPPFHVSVQVENSRTGLFVSGLSDETHITTDEFAEEEDSYYCIWLKSEGEIVRYLPGFRRPGILKFIVVLKPEDATSTLRHSAPSVQPICNSTCLESLSDDFSRLLDNGSNPDVEFLCGGQSTRAHVAVVSARSEVIASMLASDMIEGNTKRVKIPDMEPDIFQKFLRYLYTGKLDGLRFEVALSLFEAGDQYAVSGLAKRCSAYLMEHLTAQNACGVLVIADAHSDEDLVEKVVKFMVDQRVPSSSEVWLAFCDEHPRLANMVLNRGWNVLVK